MGRIRGNAIAVLALGAALIPTGARADEAAAARLLWECRAMASVLMSSVTDAKSVLDELQLMGPEGRPRHRLALHDRLQQSLVRSEMAASALVRLLCPNRAITREFEGDLRRAWTALSLNRRAVQRAIPGP